MFTKQNPLSHCGDSDGESANVAENILRMKPRNGPTPDKGLEGGREREDV